jgi:hypothetical protein
LACPSLAAAMPTKKRPGENRQNARFTMVCRRIKFLEETCSTTFLFSFAHAIKFSPVFEAVNNP